MYWKYNELDYILLFTAGFYQMFANEIDMEFT